MIFSKIDRTNTKPKSYAEPAYRYLDQSARPEAQTIRNVLEGWFARYPKTERAEFLGKFKSDDDVQHLSAAFELYLHELFLRLGYSVLVHPTTSSDKSTRPDFLLQSPDGRKLYVEAVQSSDTSAKEKGANARLNVVYDQINKVESNKWFVGVDISDYPETPPSGKNLRKFLKNWLEELNFDQATALSGQDNFGALPRCEYSEGKWKICFTAIPRNPELHNEPADSILGAIFPDARWLSTSEVVRNSLKAKGTHYGKIDAPLIIVVSANVFDIDEIDEMEALFGTEEFLMNVGQPNTEPRMRRAKDGFWHGPKGPQFTRVSGVIFGFNITPWNFAVRNLMLYQNPWATSDVWGPVLKLPRRTPSNSKIESVPGAHPKDILDLPPGYPGL